MKHPNDMTLGECRDELARNAGWTLNTSYRCPVWERGIESTVVCPIPATLDEAAELPEGWGFEISKSNWWTDTSDAAAHQKKIAYSAVAHEMKDDYHDDGMMVIMEECESELLARFRLRVAVERATRADAAEGGAP